MELLSLQTVSKLMLKKKVFLFFSFYIGSTHVSIRVLYIPHFKRLLSISQLQSLGIQVDFPRDRPICRLSIHYQMFLKFHAFQVYIFLLHISAVSNLMASPVSDASILLKHAQLGHPGIAFVKEN